MARRLLGHDGDRRNTCRALRLLAAVTVLVVLDVVRRALPRWLAGAGAHDSERRLALKAEALVGTWRLRSWRNVGADGSAVDPLGEGPLGYIFYNHDGYMAVEIMAAHRAPYRTPDPLGGTLEERSEAIGTYISYCGRFEVPSDRDAVVHHIEVCSYPNWIGEAQVRFARLEGDLLILSTEPMTIQGVERTAELVWERVGRD